MRSRVTFLLLSLSKPLTRGGEAEKQTKSRGELFASNLRKFDSRETHADLTSQLLANRVTNFAHALWKTELLSAEATFRTLAHTAKM